MIRLVALHIGGSSEPWERIGLCVRDAVAQVSTVRLEFGKEGGGIVSWEFAVDDESIASAAIDGLSTVWSPLAQVIEPSGGIGGHFAPEATARTTTTIDHVVVMTDDLERTCGAIEMATELPLKRIRDAGGGRRQGFFRTGEVVIEVVGPVGTGARLWGLVFTVDDLPGVCDRLGPDIVGLPKAAVQPGRFIASVRSEVGLGLPVALMSR
jgi:hypothetical protein